MFDFKESLRLYAQIEKKILGREINEKLVIYAHNECFECFIENHQCMAYSLFDFEI